MFWNGDLPVPNTPDLSGRASKDIYISIHTFGILPSRLFYILSPDALIVLSGLRHHIGQREGLRHCSFISHVSSGSVVSPIVTAAAIVCEQSALLEWQSGFLVELVGPAGVSCCQTLAIQLFYCIDRLLICWGLVNRKTIETEVATNQGAVRNLLIGEKVLACLKEGKSTQGAQERGG